MERIFRRENGGLDWQSIGVAIMVFIVSIMFIFVMIGPSAQLFGLDSVPDTDLEWRISWLEDKVELLEDENRLLQAFASGRFVLRFDFPEGEGYTAQFPDSPWGILANNEWMIWDPEDGTRIVISNKDHEVELDEELAPILRPGDLVWARKWVQEGEDRAVLDVVHLDGTAHCFPRSYCYPWE